MITEVHLTQLQVNQICGAIWELKRALDDLWNVFFVWSMVWIFFRFKSWGRGR